MLQGRPIIMQTNRKIVYALLFVVVGLCPAFGGNTAFSLRSAPTWYLGWTEHAAPGSILISGSRNGAWIVDLETNILLRIGQDLTNAAATPLPPALRTDPAKPLRRIHVAGFGPAGAWLLDVDAQTVWRYSDKKWLGPLTFTESFVRGAAMSAQAVALNTPSGGSPFAVLDSGGQIVGRFGKRTKAPFEDLATDYGNWALAAKEGEWTAGHQFLPVLERYLSDGTTTWRHRMQTSSVRHLEEDRLSEIARAKTEASQATTVDIKLVHFAEALQYLSDGSVVVNFSAAPSLVRLFQDERTPEQYMLEGIAPQEPDKVLALDRFGFAMIGDWILAPVHGELRAFAREQASGPTGRVVDPSGAPVAGARVLVDPDAGDAQLAVADPEGDFVLGMLDVDTAVTMVVSAPGFLDNRLFGRAEDLLREPLVLRNKPEVCVQVVDSASGEPIEDFEVELNQLKATGTVAGASLSYKEGPRRKVQGETGQVCLSAPWEGSLQIKVLAPGYAVAVKRIESGGPIKMDLKEETRLKVVAQDADGTPLAAASVLLLEPGALLQSAWKESFRAETDAEGVARLSQIEDGEWDLALVLAADGGVQAQKRIHLEPGDNETELTMEESVSVQVTVVGSEGAPQPGVLVQLQPTASVGMAGREDQTDGKGQCLFSRIEPGRYTAAALVTGERFVRQPVSIESGSGWQEVTLDLGGGKETAGRLVGTELYPGMEFSLYAEAEGFVLPDVKVATDDSFVLNGVSSGARARILVEGNDRSADRVWTIMQTMVVIPDPGEWLTIELPLPSTAMGRVDRGQRPCAACLMEWGTDLRGQQPRAMVTTGAGGEYTALLEAPGDYRVQITDDQGNTHIRSVRLTAETAETTLNFQLGEGRINGVVISTNLQDPVKTATVSLSDEAGEMIGTRMTGSDGGFSFSGLLPGVHRLTASARDLAAEKVVTVSSRDTIQVTLEVEDGRAVELYLRDGITGQPISRCLAQVYNGKIAMVADFMGKLSPDGRLVVGVPGDGPFTAVVSGSGLGTVTVPGLKPGSPPPVVELMPGSQLLLEGTPGERGTFQLVTLDGQVVALGSQTPPGPISFIGPALLLRDIAAGRYRAQYVAWDNDVQQQWDLVLDSASPSVLVLDGP